MKVNTTASIKDQTNQVTAVFERAGLKAILVFRAPIATDISIDVSPPIAQAMADKIIEHSGLDIMAAIDDLPIPSDPSTVVKN